MDSALLQQLHTITDEERAIIEGRADVERDRYTASKEFVVDSRKLLAAGRLIEIRPHTRFVRFPAHRHNYVELIYMCSGTTTHIINGKDQLVLQEGDLLFLNQQVYHEILPAGENDIAVNFIILPEFFDRSFLMLERENVIRDFLISALNGNSTLSGYLHFQANDILPVQNLTENMIWTLINRPSISNSLNQTTMGLLLMSLTQFAETINRSKQISREDNLIFSTLKYIETHYKSGTLEAIAEELTLPAYQLSRILKKHTGQNFKELLIQRKLQQAVYLLGNTELSIENIMENIGYMNSSFFFRTFRQKYGCSPAEYRKKQ